jgi:hypothetical protein
LPHNAYLLDLYRDELPGDAREVRRFVRGHALVSAQLEETVERVCTTLEAEFSSSI